jgi:hypothetical protein
VYDSVTNGCQLDKLTHIGRNYHFLDRRVSRSRPDEPLTPLDHNVNRPFSCQSTKSLALYTALSVLNSSIGLSCRDVVILGYLTRSVKETFMASANRLSMLKRGSVVFLRNCHADFRAGSPEYPIRCPSSSRERPELSNNSLTRAIVS